jgi:cytoskeletal protein RodZ
MPRKLLATLTTVAALSLLVGVAWAGPGGGASIEATADTSTNASVGSTEASVAGSTDATVSTSADSSSTSTTTDSSTSTSVDDSTSTSLQSTTSTSIASTTSTSVDDNDDSVAVAAQGTTVHTIPGVGVVTVEVVGNALVLVNVSAPGWSVHLDKIESDRIEIEFESGESEAEFEARLDGQLRVEVEVDSH